jgi:hypothetical protein
VGGEVGSEARMGRNDCLRRYGREEREGGKERITWETRNVDVG